jgi:hypothetical protein
MCARALAIALFSLVALGGWDTARPDWETTRKTVIDPLNGALHRHLPTFLKNRDLEAVLALYATDVGTGLTWDGAHIVYPGREEEMWRWAGPTGSESIRARYQRLLDLLPTIERAELRIRRVEWRTPDAAGYPAEVRLLVRGIRADGARCQLDQHAHLHIAQRDGQWLITGEEVTARETVARARPAFETVTQAAGIDNVHTNEGSPVYKVTDNLANAGGSAVADVDGDGWEDIFLAGSPNIALYRNTGQGTFVDITEEAGLPRPYPAAATGVVFFDYDNDGWPDLYIAASRGGDRLFHNVGGGRFVDVTAVAGIPAREWSSMPIVADYDRDGFLDLYIVRMGDHEKHPPRPNYEAHNGLPGTLLHNNGDGTFTDVTRAAHVGDTGWNLAGAWGDYDNDGWPDLYLANEFGSDALYHNNRDGTFTERGRAAGADDPGAGMGVAWGDYDGDGFLDIYVSDMYANSRWALFHPEFPAPIPWRYRLLGLFTSEVQRHSDEIFDGLTRGSTLLHNNGDGTFSDVSEAAGVRDGQWGWGAEFLDYDNDGRLDIYATNGFITGAIPDDV